jgi:hypothetical protein
MRFKTAFFSSFDGGFTMEVLFSLSYVRLLVLKESSALAQLFSDIVAAFSLVFVSVFVFFRVWKIKNLMLPHKFS